MKADSYAVFETASGFCGIAWSDDGITRFQLPTDNAAATERLLLRRMSNAKAAEPTPDITGVIDVVRRYFEGSEVDFSDLNLDLEGQDDLFKQIYALARRLPWGQTTTYGALAKEIDADPRLARDVGQAMAKNPIPLIIPCHRVLAAGGKVGGFSAPGGAASKVRMLELEGVVMAPEEPAQQSLGF
ncbi:methylated-DNA--[protein]-cysteine S-methyltransferase [Afipia sp. 1NLS2]|uniref:methylated-DNA--[protein]-cysteine S-methyltransferase n=1 Tax=Afipia sp. 1NLS2 TaxID=666684 RepID=UPI0001D9EB97|nr:methylated-DNA--[protein]-cysteine S-methyltransferase [Afipia sp. 1NLS2]EFI51709.1 methylated-DNA/protein-cysteine methyltransferase [Afipia sp. 1NLS2]